MIKSILEPVEGQKNDVATLRTARELAMHFDAHLDCLYVRPDPAQLVTVGAAFPIGAGMIAGGVVDALGQEEEEEEKPKLRGPASTISADFTTSRSATLRRVRDAFRPRGTRLRAPRQIFSPSGC